MNQEEKKLMKNIKKEILQKMKDKQKTATMRK